MLSPDLKTNDYEELPEALESDGSNAWGNSKTESNVATAPYLSRFLSAIWQIEVILGRTCEMNLYSLPPDADAVLLSDFASA